MKDYSAGTAPVSAANLSSPQSEELLGEVKTLCSSLSPCYTTKYMGFMRLRGGARGKELLLWARRGPGGCLVNW